MIFEFVFKEYPYLSYNRVTVIFNKLHECEFHTKLDDPEAAIEEVRRRLIHDLMFPEDKDKK